LKTEGGLWNERERCGALDRKEATLGFVLVHHHEDLCPVLCSRVDSQEYKLWAKDFKRLSEIQRPNFQSPHSAPPLPQRSNNTQNTGVVGPCFSCGQSGHYANRCPRKSTNQMPAPGINQNINRSANNNASTPARQKQARTRVNHVAVEDAQAAPDVIIGMILVNDNGAIVLFDSGASHSFVAANFVQKYNLSLAMLKNQMIVSSPGGDMHARHVFSKVNIHIKG
jgi:hypothetical protein